MQNRWVVCKADSIKPAFNLPKGSKGFPAPRPRNYYEQEDQDEDGCYMPNNLINQENIECTFFSQFLQEDTDQPPRKPKLDADISNQREFNVVNDRPVQKGIKVRSEFKSSNLMMYGSAYQPPKPNNIKPAPAPESRRSSLQQGFRIVARRH